MKDLAAIIALILFSGFVSGCGAEQNQGAACSPLNESSPSTPMEVQLPVGARARIWDKAQTDTGIVFVSGVDGGFIEPVDGIYQRLASRLSQQNVASVFVRYRRPGELEASVNDALSAVEWLRAKGVRKMALVGWSFGGAVITNSAVRIPEVRTVVGFAIQARYTEPVSQFGSRSLLLFHDYGDDNVPYEAVRQILDELSPQARSAHYPLSGSDHYLTGKQEEIDPIVFDWLKQELDIQPCR